MENTNLITLSLIVINGYLTYKAFNDRSLYEKYLFEVDAILIGKDYVRLISSGFLHINWSHFFFNMISLTLFTYGVLGGLGFVNFLLIYFASLIGGNLLALYIHRNHGDYRAVGASGAVSGVMMASVLLNPGMSIWFIPAWLFAIGFVLYTIYGIKSSKDNIGHEAHLGGALIGILLLILLKPAIIELRGPLVLALLIPIALFLYLVVKRPEMLFIPNYFRYEFKEVKQQFKTKAKMKMKPKISPQVELDRLLEKVQEVGYENLSKQEKKRLEELSKDNLG